MAFTIGIFGAPSSGKTTLAKKIIKVRPDIYYFDWDEFVIEEYKKYDIKEDINYLAEDSNNLKRYPEVFNDLMKNLLKRSEKQIVLETLHQEVGSFNRKIYMMDSFNMELLEKRYKEKRLAFPWLYQYNLKDIITPFSITNNDFKYYGDENFDELLEYIN